jgi:hypothetical protein
MSTSQGRPSKVPEISAGISGIVLFILGLSCCRNVQTESKWFGLVTERVDKGPDWFSILLLVGIGSIVAYLFAWRMTIGRAPGVVLQSISNDCAKAALPAQSADELLAAATGQNPITLVLTGKIDGAPGSHPALDLYKDLPLPAKLTIGACVLGILIWDPFESTHLHFRFWVAIGAGLLLGAFFRFFGFRTHVPIHDALVVGDAHVWLLIGCRLDRRSQAITCDAVQKHERDHLAITFGRGVRAPLSGGHLVYLQVKAPGDRFKVATYRLQQGKTHSDRQFFTKGVVSVAEAEAQMAPLKIAEIMKDNPQESSVPPSIPPSGPSLVGVRGWFLVCCVWFSLVEPAFTLLSSPGNTELDQFGMARSAFVICLSVAAGVLMFLRKRIGVVLARAQCVVGVLFWCPWRAQRRRRPLAGGDLRRVVCVSGAFQKSETDNPLTHEVWDRALGRSRGSGKKWAAAWTLAP